MISKVLTNERMLKDISNGVVDGTFYVEGLNDKEYTRLRKMEVSEGHYLYHEGEKNDHM